MLSGPGREARAGGEVAGIASRPRSNHPAAVSVHLTEARGLVGLGRTMKPHHEIASGRSLNYVTAAQ